MNTQIPRQTHTHRHDSLGSLLLALDRQTDMVNTQSDRQTDMDNSQTDRQTDRHGEYTDRQTDMILTDHYG